MIVYGLSANGTSICDWQFQANSKSLFKTKEEAIDYIPEFEKKCFDNENYLDAADPEKELHIGTIEYDLRETNKV